VEMKKENVGRKKKSVIDVCLDYYIIQIFGLLYNPKTLYLMVEDKSFSSSWLRAFELTYSGSYLRAYEIR